MLHNVAMPASKLGRQRPDLIAELVARGLEVSSTEWALTVLAQYGYHRLGGYLYPFRTMLPEEERDASKAKFRRDEFEPGSKLEDAVRLAEFDTKLREVCARGCLDFEIRLRTAIADTLASRDPHAHLLAEHLNADSCSEVRDPGSGDTKLDSWTNTCVKRRREAKERDPVRHHILTYGPDLYVWIQCEVSTIGDLPFLFDLMKDEDRAAVSKQFGVGAPQRFGAWVRSIGDLRNVCMHGGRLFNAELKRDVKVNSAAGAGPLLSHLFTRKRTGPESIHVDSKKLYSTAAVLAYMLRSHAAPSGWHRDFRSQIAEVPDVALEVDGALLVTPSKNMGFPPGWEQQDLWS